MEIQIQSWLTTMVDSHIRVDLNRSIILMPDKQAIADWHAFYTVLWN